jgi:outer membrane protein
MLRVLTLITVFIFTGVSYAQTKLACVDTNRILQESKLVAEAQKELREKLLKYQKELGEKERKLEELKKQIDVLLKGKGNVYNYSQNIIIEHSQNLLRNFF